jgi:LacI family transcriptional regulator
MSRLKRILYFQSRDDLQRRSMLRGFQSFAVRHDWLVEVAPSGNVDFAEAMLRAVNPDVCIAGPWLWTEMPGLFDGQKIVGLDVDLSAAGHPSSIMDNRAAGQTIARFLLQKSFGHLATYGDRQSWSADRAAAFRQVVESSSRNFVGAFLTGHGGRGALRTWLASLPARTAILATCDRFAETLIVECRLLGIHVPEQLAIIGVDNEELICDFCVPQLSSLQMPYFRQGEAAAIFAHRLLHGRAIADLRFALGPGGVVERQSTETLASDNPALVAALQFIRKRWDKPLQVDDVARAAVANRRWLERAFLKHIGHGIAKEIQYVRVMHVKRLLTSTALPIHDVANQCGFRDATIMGMTFRAITRTTPSAYRRQFIASE